MLPADTITATTVRDARGTEVGVGTRVNLNGSDRVEGIVSNITFDHPYDTDRGVAWLTIDAVQEDRDGTCVSTGTTLTSVRASRVYVVPAAPVAPADRPRTTFGVPGYSENIDQARGYAVPAVEPGTHPRGTVRERTSESGAVTRSWARVVRGTLRAYTLVVMPDGECRIITRAFNGYVGGIKFDCAFGPARWITFTPTIAPVAPVAPVEPLVSPRFEVRPVGSVFGVWDTTGGMYVHRTDDAGTYYRMSRRNAQRFADHLNAGTGVPTAEPDAVIGTNGVVYTGSIIFRCPTYTVVAGANTEWTVADRRILAASYACQRDRCVKCGTRDTFATVRLGRATAAGNPIEVKVCSPCVLTLAAHANRVPIERVADR